MSIRSSDAISVARVICIIFMSYVHLHFAEIPDNNLRFFREVIADTLGRSSVPLLSIISGYLMVGFFAKRTFANAVGQRARTLIVPMLIWNSAAILLWGWDGINDLIPITENSKLIYLTFLRDIFVMSAITPVLAWLARNNLSVLISSALLIYLIDFSTVFILRPQILFFYSIGVIIAIYPIKLADSWKVFSICALIAMSVSSVIWPSMNDSHLFDAILKRPIASLGFWAISITLAKNLPSLARLDIYAFPFFLCHGIIFNVFGSQYYHSGILQYPSIYLWLWLITPPLCFLIVSLTWPSARRVKGFINRIRMHHQAPPL